MLLGLLAGLYDLIWAENIFLAQQGGKVSMEQALDRAEAWQEKQSKKGAVETE